jgi:hypothetical protein
MELGYVQTGEPYRWIEMYNIIARKWIRTSPAKDMLVITRMVSAETGDRGLRRSACDRQRHGESALVIALLMLCDWRRSARKSFWLGAQIEKIIIDCLGVYGGNMPRFAAKGDRGGIRPIAVSILYSGASNLFCRRLRKCEASSTASAVECRDARWHSYNSYKSCFPDRMRVTARDVLGATYESLATGKSMTSAAGSGHVNGSVSRVQKHPILTDESPRDRYPLLPISRTRR